MVYILDTDVLSNLRKQRKNPSVQAWVQMIGLSELSTTVINVAEIQCGIDRQMPNQPAYAIETQRWLDVLLGVGGPSIWSLGVAAALLLAHMHETPALRNFVMPDPKQKKSKTAGDLAIAAIAISGGATIATGNVGHFQDIHAHFPLPGLFDPFTATWVINPACEKAGS